MGVPLHLSRFYPSSPTPGLQRLNALLHEEPYSILAYGVTWTLLLMIGAPAMGLGVVLLTLVRLCWWAYERAHPDPVLGQTDEMQLAVIITGCDTGFGQETVARLVNEGFVVFCGCLVKDSFAQFENEPNAIPIQIDVTKDEQIQDASKRVWDWLHDAEATKKQSRCLHALVNNAGIGKIGYLDWLEISDYQVCMDVNFFGGVRMVKAFLPIFKEQASQRGYMSSQIINVVSMAGVVSGGGLGLSAYESAKHAMEAFTDGLRLEMKMFGVSVVAVNPSFHSTPLVDSVADRIRTGMWLKIPAEKRAEYGEEFFDHYSKHVEASMNSAKWDMHVVVNEMVRILLSRNPPAQVLVGSDARSMILILKMLPQWLRNFVVETLVPNKKPAIMENSTAKSSGKKKEKDKTP